MDVARRALNAEDDERRSLEAALHEGALQELTALAAALQTVPDAAELRELVHTAIDSLRALATRLHPALLDSSGLLAAVRMAAAGAHVEGTLDQEVPPEIALTVCRCVAASHAESIAVRTTGGVFDFEIRGDVAAVERLAPRVAALRGTLDVYPGLAVGRLPLSLRPGT
jgi:hypothetical protein